MSSNALRLVFLFVLPACSPAENVEVMPLPPLERMTPEARLGLPEVSGVWRFAGWEVVGVDSTALERTYPSFGELTIQVQRLDSVAGAFGIGGTPVPVIGEVRRDGWMALVTVNGNAPTAFVTGRVLGDTLWLVLSSIVPATEWPRDARAAFVQNPSIPPLTWLRGTVPGQPVLAMPTDSLPAATIAPVAGTVPPGPAVLGTPVEPAIQQPPPSTNPEPVRTPEPAGVPVAPPSPPPPPPPPPAAPPPADPEPLPQAEPEAQPDGPPLLGVPIQR